MQPTYTLTIAEPARTQGRKRRPPGRTCSFLTQTQKTRQLTRLLTFFWRVAMPGVCKRAPVETPPHESFEHTSEGVAGGCPMASKIRSHNICSYAAQALGCQDPPACPLVWNSEYVVGKRIQLWQRQRVGRRQQRVQHLRRVHALSRQHRPPAAHDLRVFTPHLLIAMAAEEQRVMCLSGAQPSAAPARSSRPTVRASHPSNQRSNAQLCSRAQPPAPPDLYAEDERPHTALAKFV